MRRVISRLLLAVAVAASAVACSDSDSIPTQPDNPTVTETFSGSLTPNGATTTPFVATAAGTVTATLTAVAPALNIGLALGTWNVLTSTCQVVVANDAAPATATLSGTVTSAANLCVRVYDIGSLTEGATYTVTVEHP